MAGIPPNPRAMLVDLHSHSTASDGKLTPAALVQRARERGVEVFAITDHDSIAAYAELAELDGGTAGLRLVPGIELSAQWRGQTIHVVGLNFRLASGAIQEAVAVQRAARLRRALAIAERLARKGLGDLTAAVAELGAHTSVGRPHIAELLVDRGQARSTDDAFRKYLGSGRIGDLKDEWAPLERVVGWVRDGGGSAVIAHPEKYEMTRTRLLELVADFRVAGGDALEVVSGRQQEHESRQLAKLCADAGLSASTGSDFHQPGQYWAELGNQTVLPTGCTPVWDRW